MRPTPQPNQARVTPIPVPIHSPVNPAPPTSNVAPQLTTFIAPDDPRGSKRVREDGHTDSDEPVLKQARTEPVTEVVNPQQRQLINAIEGGDLSTVKALIRDFPTLLNSRLPVDSGLPPLCLAARHGNLDMATSLLISGARVNESSNYGCTPLIFAAANGHVNVMELFCTLGADLYAKDKRGRDALHLALLNRRLEACKFLIVNGVDMQQQLRLERNGNLEKVIPLRIVLAMDFAELLAWWLDFKNLPVDTHEKSSGKSLLNFAVQHGQNSIAVIRMLLERGANFNGEMKIQNDIVLHDIWEIAAHTKQYALIECLLDLGRRPALESSGVPGFARKGLIGAGTDLCIHLIEQNNAKPAADGLTEDGMRHYPEKFIEDFAQHSLFSSLSHFKEAFFWWSGHRLLAAPIVHKLQDNTVVCSYILGKNEHFSRPFEKAEGPAPAQQLQMLIELLSDAICSPEFPHVFDNQRLTPQRAQKMNQIAIAQGELLMKGIARLRERFNAQVATLPLVCMNTYISLSHQLNEPDFYRKMTLEWGLYDSVARAVLRLVKQAYGKLRDLRPNETSLEFSTMPPDEQLRHVIVDLLEEWDKIPEIVETLSKVKESKNLDIVSDLLFQQWRLFSEAFGVTKPRYSPFGPHKPENDEPDLLMEVDIPQAEKA